MEGRHCCRRLPNRHDDAPFASATLCSAIICALTKFIRFSVKCSLIFSFICKYLYTRMTPTCVLVTCSVTLALGNYALPFRVFFILIFVFLCIYYNAVNIIFVFIELLRYIMCSSVR